MNFLQLKYITTIIDEGGVSAAARKLCVSQPSLSQMLHNIEEELGVKLFDRTAGKTVLTYAGELFYDQAKMLLLNYNGLINTMKEIQGYERNRLRIGIPVSRGTYILPALLISLKKEFPLLDIETFEGTVDKMEKGLCHGEIDLVFSHYYQRNSELVYHPIVTEEWLLAIPKNHPLASRAFATPNWKQRLPLQLSELKDTPFILLRQGHTARRITDELFQQAAYSPNVILETHSNAIAHSIAASGLGATIIPEHEVRFSSMDNRCIYFSVEQRQYTRKLCLCHSKSLFISPQTTAVIARIIGVVKDIYKASDDALL